MSGDLTIYEMKFNRNEKDKKTILFTEIFSDYLNSEISNEIESLSQKAWHLEGECGSVFEVIGEDLINVFKRYEQTKNIVNDICIDDWYRAEISF